MILVMYGNFPPTDRHIAELHRLAPGLEVRVVANESDALRYAPRVEAILGHRYLRQVLPRASRLRLVQSTASGIDQLQAPLLINPRITVCRNPVGAPAIARHALALAWALLRRLPEAMDAQRRGEWSRAGIVPLLPLPRTALVLGLGGIGMELCRLLRGTGLVVRGSSRTGNDLQRSVCDEFLPSTVWRDSLNDTDLLFLSLPLDRTTRGMLGVTELAALPEHAVVINIARGGLIDMRAMTDALHEGRLGGAAVDVLEPTPDSDSDLWRTPHLLITPKIAAYHPGMQADVEAFVEAQVGRFVRGEPLFCTVSEQTLRDSFEREDTA